MNYSDDPDHVRVDIFKLSGKWYTTLELVWDRYYTKVDGEAELIHDTLRRCMQKQHPGFKGMQCVCLEPYHEHSHPISIIL